MEGGNFKEKDGGHKIPHSQSREIIAKVVRFIKQETKLRGAINFNKIQDHMAQPTGKSKFSEMHFKS